MVEWLTNERRLALLPGGTNTAGSHNRKPPTRRGHISNTIKHLSVNLPRKSLLTIYKPFVQPHNDYGDIIHDKPVNELLINKLEKVQYRACLAI